jgi:hypothetical protein
MKLLSVAFLSFVFTSGAFAAKPVTSLNDLPSKWEGVAGDLVVRTAATFSIDRILKVTRDDTGGGRLAVLYDVEAGMTLGERMLTVKQIRLDSYPNFPNHFELVLYTDDELVGNMLAIVRYDEVTDTFSLKELPHQGARRFAFSAPARK